MRFRSAHLLWAALTLSTLLIAGCAAGAGPATSAHATSTHTPLSTPTATPLPPLAWTPVKLPANLTDTGANLSISPVDGHDAWICQSTSANTFAIWKTTDAGQSWRQTGHFSYAAPMANASCGLSADQTGTSALLATIGWGCGECGNLASASLFSADGATNWRPLSGYVQDSEFATVRGGFIAIVSKTVASQQGVTQYLAFSADGFQTWRAMSSQGLPTQFFHFTVAPDGSTLIGAGYNDTLWRSTDLGAHWTQISTPDQQTGLDTWMPQRNTFLLCANNILSQSHINCSTDLGAHWSRVNILSYTMPCPVPGKCGQGVTTQTQQCVPTGVETDGTLVTQCLPNQTTLLPASGPPSTIVYLLPLGATAWQPIGSAQCSISIVPASGPAWCVATTPDQLTGYYTTQLPA